MVSMKSFLNQGGLYLILARFLSLGVWIIEDKNYEIFYYVSEQIDHVNSSRH